MTPMLAALGFDPAVASPLNLILLLAVLHFAVSIAREVRLLRDTVLREMGKLSDKVLKQAEDKARIAAGSERRAENAAAEITRLAEKVERLLEGRAG